MVERKEEMSGSGDFSIGGDLWNGISKLIEECGEVVQVAGKLIGSRGVPEHWDGTDLRERRSEELADLKAAIAFVILRNELSAYDIDRRAARKLAKFFAWDSRTHSNDVEQQRCGVCNGLVDLDEGCKRCGR